MHAWQDAAIDDMAEALGEDARDSSSVPVSLDATHREGKGARSSSLKGARPERKETFIDRIKKRWQALSQSNPGSSEERYGLVGTNATAESQAQSNKGKSANEKIAFGREVAQLLDAILDNATEGSAEETELAEELHKKAVRLQQSIANALATGEISSEDETFDALAVNDSLTAAIERGKNLAGEGDKQEHFVSGEAEAGNEDNPGANHEDSQLAEALRESARVEEEEENRLDREEEEALREAKEESLREAQEETQAKSTTRPSRNKEEEEEEENQLISLND